MSTAKSTVSLTLGYAKTGSITDVLENLTPLPGDVPARPGGATGLQVYHRRGAQTTKRAHPRDERAFCSCNRCGYDRPVRFRQRPASVRRLRRGDYGLAPGLEHHNRKQRGEDV